MTHRHFIPRRAAALLLTAAALPLAPALAQETQTQTPDPLSSFAPPPPVPQPVETVPPVQTQTAAPAPVTTAPEPVAASPAPAAETAAPRRTTRTATRTPARSAGPARAAPAQAATPAPAPAPAASAEVQPAAAEATPPPVMLPPAPTAPAEQQQSGGSNLLWIVLGALALAALAGFFLLRRRRSAAHDDVGDPAYAHAQDVAPVAAVPVDEAAPVDAGRPELELDLRPRRAGVTGDEAVVEFELNVANRGSAVARDVRVSTWMIPAGSGTEMERALIERPEGEALAEIEAGSGESIARSVTLDTRNVGGDAVLPVVVAEARYTLPDGTEGCTSTSYAVGVPDGEELAHFAIDNPSGLHDEVVAKALG
ncbi:MAG TPA: LPXTG cell wall anchor domain-containing protein [Allosphingosinicella sp.]|nr:LPXTG cell wall anchor domain-containing protein [Allosphingosinicella sp.]